MLTTRPLFRWRKRREKNRFERLWKRATAATGANELAENSVDLAGEITSYDDGRVRGGLSVRRCETRARLRNRRGDGPRTTAINRRLNGVVRGFARPTRLIIIRPGDDDVIFVSAYICFGRNEIKTRSAERATLPTAENPLECPSFVGNVSRTPRGTRESPPATRPLSKSPPRRRSSQLRAPLISSEIGRAYHPAPCICAFVVSTGPV